VLDVEDPTEQLTPGQCEAEIQIWLDLVEEAFQVKPVIYTGRWYWADPTRLNNSAKFKEYPLWHSKYSPQYPPLYGGWETPLFWQYSQNGSVQGLLGTNVAIDLNYFLGNIEALWNNTSQGLIEPSNQYNPKVEALQYILNLNGFDAGTQDGKFGARTLRALHARQQETPAKDSVTPKMWQELFALEVVPA
jgi:lysozyme